MNNMIFLLINEKTDKSHFFTFPRPIALNFSRDECVVRLHNFCKIELLQLNVQYNLQRRDRLHGDMILMITYYRKNEELTHR